MEQFPQVHYFPSYEIQLDELRDYRFFAEDMAHPSEAAVRYILSRFEDFALEKDLDFNQEWHALLKLAEHRPLSSNPERVAVHQEGVLRKLPPLFPTTFAPISYVIDRKIRGMRRYYFQKSLHCLRLQSLVRSRR